MLLIIGETVELVLCAECNVFLYSSSNSSIVRSSGVSSSDISVLEMMLAQEGLTEGDFKEVH